MKFSGKIFKLWAVATLCISLLSGHAVLAQETPPDEFVLHLEKGDRRIDGKVRSINLDRGSFVVDATSVSYPSGRPKLFDVPFQMLVSQNEKTYFHVRGKTDNVVTLADVHVGDYAVVIASYSTFDQVWNASEIAVWTRQENDQFVLEGFTAPDFKEFQREGEDHRFPAPLSIVTDWQAENSGIDITGDLAGSQQNGTAYEPGKVGAAFSFDGVDDRFSVKDNPELILTKSLTIESWIFIKPMTGMGMIIVRGDNRPGLDPYGINVRPDGTLQFHIASETENVDIDAKFPFGVWVHVAGTLDNETGVMRLYKNGRVVAETRTKVRPMGLLSPLDGAGLGIGNIPAVPTTNYNFPFHGLIDEMSLYDEALSEEEIRGIYDAGSAGKGPPAPPIIIVPTPPDFTPDTA